MASLALLVTVLSILATCCTCKQTRSTVFKVKDCSANGTHEWFTIPDLHINPDPVILPGNVTVWGTFNLTEPIVGNITLDFSIERKLGFFWLDVPCSLFKHMPDCKLDVCELLGEKVNDTIECLPQLEDSDIPCECPFQPGTYLLKHELFKIKKIQGILKTLAKGDYHVTIKLEDSGTGDILSCQKIYLTLDEDHPPTTKPPKTEVCKGFFDCIFG